MCVISLLPLSTVNAYLQGQRGKRGIPAERASKLFHAVGVSEEQVAAASGAFAVGRVFTMNFDAALERAVQEARESVPLPNHARSTRSISSGNSAKQQC